VFVRNLFKMGLVFACFLILTGFRPEYRLGNPSPYNFKGERLFFHLYWTIFHVANAETKVEKTTFRGQPAYMFYDTVSTAGLAILFKRIRDWAKAFWNPIANIPLYVEEHQQEGHYHKMKTYVFDYTQKIVIHTNRAPNKKQGQTKINPILAQLFCDVHSAMYFFRKYGRFKVGETTIFPICTGTKFANVKLKVIAKERIKSPWGKVEAFKIEPSSELNVKGFFSRKGKVYIWIKADETRIPLKVKARVKIGSVRAILTKAVLENGQKGDHRR